MKYTAIVDGRQLQVALNGSGHGSVIAEIGGRKYVLETKAIESGLFWFNWNNRSIEVAVTPNSEGYVVSINGRSVAVEIVDTRSALRKAAQHGHEGAFEIRAPMPGKVVKVLLAEGSEVQANQGVLVIEAMKMQNELKSPKKGIVKKVAVKDADAVNAGDLLAVVE